MLVGSRLINYIFTNPFCQATNGDNTYADTFFDVLPEYEWLFIDLLRSVSQYYSKNFMINSPFRTKKIRLV